MSLKIKSLHWKKIGGRWNEYEKVSKQFTLKNNKCFHKDDKTATLKLFKNKHSLYGWDVIASYHEPLNSMEILLIGIKYLC